MSYIETTKSQRKALKRIIQQSILRNFYDLPRGNRLLSASIRESSYEIKKLEVEKVGRLISVYIVIGGKNDEGTYAEIFARNKLHIFIGERGGLRAYTEDRRVRRENRKMATAHKTGWHAFIYGWQI